MSRKREIMSMMRRAKLNEHGFVVGFAPTAAELACKAFWRCPGCGNSMFYGGSASLQPTLDHVLPICRGGQAFIHNDVPNTRLLCSGCNGLLAVCGHCPGAKSALTAVSSDKLMDPRTVARNWNMQQVASAAERQFREKRAESSRTHP